MRNGLFGFQKKRGDEVNALAIQNDTRGMLRQLMLPLIPERRVKGALSLVSRETGLPFSKLRRLYYGITDHILAFEWRAIQSAHTRWLEEQEKKLAIELETLRALRVARSQGRLDLADTPNTPSAVETGTHKTADAD